MLATCYQAPGSAGRYPSISLSLSLALSLLQSASKRSSDPLASGAVLFFDTVAGVQNPGRHPAFDFCVPCLLSPCSANLVQQLYPPS